MPPAGPPLGPPIPSLSPPDLAKVFRAFNLFGRKGELLPAR